MRRSWVERSESADAMSIGTFMSSRPRWPGTTGEEEPSLGALARSACLVVATLFCAVAMTVEWFFNQALAPVARALRWLVERRARSTSAAWVATFVAALACLAFTAVARSFGATLRFAIALPAAYVLLGAFRWSSHWLMNRESRYESYPAMLAALDRGLTGWFIARLRRREDVVWIRHTALSTLVHLPPTLALVLWGTTSWFASVWFLVAIFASVKTGGANHNIGHSRPFVRFGKTRLDRAVGGALSLWYHFGVELLEGDVPHLTISGHNLIHHVENNGPKDFESSYPYDRTSFVSASLLYFNCALSYSFGVGILGYLWARRRIREYKSAFVRTTVGLVWTYGLVVAIGLALGPKMAAFVLAVRLLQAGLRYGTFAYTSHAFVDPDDPTNSFSNSMEAGTRGTLMLGGGQHALHHARPGRHWARLTADRAHLGAEYTDNGTVVFPYELIPFVQPLILAKRFDVLAQWVMAPDDVAAYERDPDAKPWSPRPRGDDVARRLERRARPATWEPPGPFVARVDAIAAGLLLRATGTHRFLAGRVS